MVIPNLLGTTHLIRPSSIPAWQDCARRTAAELFKIEITQAGYKLRSRPRNIGATVGKATHTGVAYMADVLLESGTRPESPGESVDAAEADLDHELGEGCAWDDVTNSKNDAQQQVKRMVGAYHEKILPLIEPASVETRLECNFGDGFVSISGQTDLREASGIRDLKTGRIQRANVGQYGAYSLINRAHGHEVDYLIEDYVPRASIRKPQPEPLSTRYDVTICENEAMDVILDMKAALSEFLRRLGEGGKPPNGAFRANPMSMLCGEKWCSAWGTNFCRVHKGAT